MKILRRTTFDKLEVGELFASNDTYGNFLIFEKLENGQAYQLGSDYPVWGKKYMKYLEQDGIYKLSADTQRLWKN